MSASAWSVRRKWLSLCSVCSKQVEPIYLSIRAIRKTACASCCQTHKPESC